MGPPLRSWNPTLACTTQVKRMALPLRTAPAAMDLRSRGPGCLVYNTKVYPPRRVKLEQPEQLAQLQQREQFGQLVPLV